MNRIGPGLARRHDPTPLLELRRGLAGALRAKADDTTTRRIKNGVVFFESSCSS
jgi:hypothetical protein